MLSCALIQFKNPCSRQHWQDIKEQAYLKVQGAYGFPGQTEMSISQQWSNFQSTNHASN